MVVIITGASHTGKTNLAQELLISCGYNYLSIDLLKMGLIRSGNTSLTPYDDAKLESYLWPIVQEIIKTVIENHQNLVIEGAYVPINAWRNGFTSDELKKIRFICLVMTESYIEGHMREITGFENVVEYRKVSGISKDELILDNNYYRFGAYSNLDFDNELYIVISDNYDFDSMLGTVCQFIENVGS